MMNALTRRRLFSDFVKFGITLVLLGLLLTRVDLRAMVAQIVAIGVETSSACVGVVLLLSLLVALRWKLILGRMDVHLGLTECWRLVMIGLFFNQTLPSGIGGDAIRVWLVGARGPRASDQLPQRSCGSHVRPPGGADLHAGDVAGAAPGGRRRRRSRC